MRFAVRAKPWSRRIPPAGPIRSGFQLNALEREAKNSPNHPEKRGYQKHYSVLGSGQIPHENVDERHRAKYHAKPKPPDDPVVNTYVNRHDSSRI